MSEAMWKQPELRPGDQLVEAEVVLVDGTRQPITVLVRADGGGSFTAEGFSRSLDLPPGAEVSIPLPGIYGLREDG